MRRIAVEATAPAPAVLAEAAAVIRQGGVVAFPTDTLYGLAADPRDARAVARIYDIKGRAAQQPLPLIAADYDQVARCLGEPAALGRRLARRFWPGPLTLVIRASVVGSVGVHAPAAGVAVRVPNHAIAQHLARAVTHPITATSANRSGEEAAVDADAVARTVGAQVDVVLDAGPTPGGSPSTIVDVTGDAPRLVRAGAIPWDRVLESVARGQEED